MDYKIQNRELYFNSFRLLKITYILLGIFFLLTIPATYWYYPILGYIFVALCNSIGHKYFSHKQFKVNKLGKIVLSFLSTVGAYSPIVFWQAFHWHHHLYADTEKDIHAPKYGILNSSFLWTFKIETTRKVLSDKHSMVIYIRCLKDSITGFFSRYFFLINVSFALILFGIDWHILAYGYFVGYFLEHIRVGLVNACCHQKVLGSYKNYDTKDDSYNNKIIGILSLGFGWHNNHHAYPGKLDTKTKWWELDLESLFGKIMTKLFPA